MNTSALAEVFVRPETAPSCRTQSVFPDRDSGTVSSWGTPFDLRADQYQVALVPMGTSSPEDDDATCDPAMPRLLLLPLTWDDVLNRIHSDATQLQITSCADVAQFGNVRIDFQRHETRRAGQPVELTAFEFKVLKFFLKNPYRVISRHEFLDRVWGYNCYPTTRSVDNQILRLRQKLETQPANPVHFQTVHGVGYKFVP